MWSLAIPEGLAMDPMAPTALAITSDFMDHLGNGLTILKDHGKKMQKYVWGNRRLEMGKKCVKSVVNVVLIEAKELPDSPDSGTSSLYCKFKLGTESHKSKRVAKTKATWRERFNLCLYEDTHLEVAVWNKGKQKNFMGRCTIELSQLENDKTHDLWQQLECGFGQLHLLVTVTGTGRRLSLDAVPTTNGVSHMWPAEDRFSWYRLCQNWEQVGQLTVTVHGTRGLSSRADAYCILELDNSRVQTHTVHGGTDPFWNKSYVFDINDITSTLDVTVCDDSLMNSLKGETLGTLSIPLLRVDQYEKKWYALKNRSKTCIARGNCPRILLEMSLVWNPIKASLRVLSPKETRYIEKPPKFDIPLIYNNLKVIKDVFNVIYRANEHVKHSFEWNNHEKSAIALVGWLIFWYFFRIWMAPLLLLIPFLYHYPTYRTSTGPCVIALYQGDDDSEEESEIQKDDKTIKTRLFGLQDLTFTIKNGVDYLVSTLERLNNLTNFTVPYLSYLAMTVLLAGAVVLYVIPINYLFMALGIYKFTRKIWNPSRRPNNDLLDFLSRVPDNKILKEWRELKVPEPNQSLHDTRSR